MTAARMRIVARVGAPRSSLPSFFLLSITLHAGFVAAMLFLPSLRSPKTFPIEPAIEAVLLPAPRQPAPPEPAPVTTPAVEPEPEQPDRELTAADEDPPEPIADPDPPPKPKPKPRVDKPKPAAPATASPRGPREDGPVGNPDGGEALAGMGSEFNWYREAVARALYSSWRQPVLNAAEPLEVAVSFEILSGGVVRNVRIERESGVAAVDRSVLRAVQEATLPPLPRNYRRGVQPALFVFRLYPE